jgi:DNA-binding HxlR family transcriptional regulator
LKIRSAYTCPLEIVHDIIKGKWKTIIMFQLRKGNLTLSELERGIEGITQKMLLQQLNELQKFGLVAKNVFPGYPLHVEYFLTEPRGRKMLQAIQIMQEVGIEYMEQHGMERRKSTATENTTGLEDNTRDTHQKVGN